MPVKVSESVILNVNKYLYSEYVGGHNCSVDGPVGQAKDEEDRK